MLSLFVSLSHELNRIILHCPRKKSVAFELQQQHDNSNMFRIYVNPFMWTYTIINDVYDDVFVILCCWVGKSNAKHVDGKPPGVICRKEIQEIKSSFVKQNH